MRLAPVLLVLAALLGACQSPTEPLPRDEYYVGPRDDGTYHDYFDYYNGEKHGGYGVFRPAY